MDHEITRPQPLLDEKGRLNSPGWSRQLYADYDRSRIRANRLRIKDWDYYYVSNGRYVVALTIADLSYAGLVTATVIDLQQEWEHSVTDMPLLPLGKLGVPVGDMTGDVRYRGKKLDMAFLQQGEQRRLICHAPNFFEGKALSIDITLHQPPMDTMVIATPWKEAPKAFYYNQKINCMRASGTAVIDDLTITYDGNNSFSTLDRGRGVWTYDNTWYWGSGNSLLGDAPFGFNIGYGFGDTSRASENIIFYRHKGHKLGRLAFEIPPQSFCDPDLPWRFRTDDGRLDMQMRPRYDRRAWIKMGPVLNDGHQVFGTFSGWCVLDDGTRLDFDGVDGFAEKVHNRY